MATRIVFLGTPEFAVPSLQALLEAPDDELKVVGALTQPDRPAGRGQKLQAPPVKKLAESAGLPLCQTASLKKDPQALEWIRDLDPGLMVVVAFGQILVPHCFELPPHGTLNVHASLLPRYRGAAPAAHALLNGDRITGVTIMKIDQGMDSGDVLTRREVSIGANTTRGELEQELAHEGAQLLLETIPGYLSGEIRPQPQDHQKATLAPRISKEDGKIDWSHSASQIHNRIRACNPWPGARGAFRGQPLKIWESRLVPERRAGEGAQPGQLVEAASDRLTVCCSERTLLRLTWLQPPNRKRICANDFINGFQPRVGESLGGI